MELDKIISSANDLIKKTIEFYGNQIPSIVISPFGKNGMIFKHILNVQYGICEKYIVDNLLAKYNPQIITTDELEKREEDLCVFLTTTKLEINKELEEKLKGDKRNIFNIMRPTIVNVHGKKEYFRYLYELLKPFVVKNKKMIRIGRNNDGGYIMLDDFADDMKAYSFGICDDISWDMDVHSVGNMNVYMFDHTINRLPMYIEGCSWKKMGIGITDQKDLLSLKTILEKNGDLHNRNLILKMDIEGAEWEILNDLGSDIICNFKQMVFELHNLTDISTQNLIMEVLKKINKTHQVSWIHGNNFGIAEFDSGYLMPESMEVLWVRKDTYEILDVPHSLPFEMDMPNDPMKVDFDLTINEY